MVTPPHLVRRDGEYRLDVSVGSTGRRELVATSRLSTALAPRDVRSTPDRTTDLRDIAEDL